MWNKNQVPVSQDIFMKYLADFFSISKLFRIFADVSAYCGQEAHWDVRSCWVEHYILEGVTDALFLAVRNLGTFEWWSRQMQM